MTPTPTKSSETRLSLLEEWKDTLDHELFGNGQPGRFDKLEKKIDRLTIVVAGLAGASGFGAAKLVEWLAG